MTVCGPRSEQLWFVLFVLFYFVCFVWLFVGCCCCCFPHELPFKQSISAGVVAIALVDMHSMLLKQDGSVWTTVRTIMTSSGMGRWPPGTLSCRWCLVGRRPLLQAVTTAWWWHKMVQYGPRVGINIGDASIADVTLFFYYFFVCWIYIFITYIDCILRVHILIHITSTYIDYILWIHITSTYCEHISWIHIVNTYSHHIFWLHITNAYLFESLNTYMNTYFWIVQHIFPTHIFSKVWIHIWIHIC